MNSLFSRIASVFFVCLLIPGLSLGQGTCLEAHSEPGCDCPECEEIVCGLDGPYCCTVEWDAICVNLAGQFCTSVSCDPEAAALLVPFDIKFCSDPNALNCKKSGVVPATVFGTNELNVTDIDLSSLALCLEDLSLCTSLPPTSYSVADRGDPTSDLGAALCQVVEGVEMDYLNPDGFDDLDVGFDAEDLVDLLFDGCSSLEKHDATPTLVLVGSLYSGEPIQSTPVGNLGIDQLLIQNK